jgi:phosphomannomutase
MPRHDRTEVVRAATSWLADDPDPRTRAEIEALITGLPDAFDALADRFAGPLTFGTAGLRGPVRAGPNGMNRAVVRAAAAGLVAYLDGSGVGAGTGPIVVGFDARHGSTAFAAETASVITGAGGQALVLPRPLPTPVLAYAVRALGARAGVMVTASHNPPADNGYKVYAGDGAQIVPPTDRGIEAAIRAVGSLQSVPLGPPGETLGEDIVEAYVDAVATTAVAVVTDPAELTTAARQALVVAYTPLHGVGRELLDKVFTRAGFAAPAVVESQAKPDPDFPTVAFPNPEEPGATDALLTLAARIDADVAIANDPDADRCAVVVRDPDAPGGRRLLRGDELGVLLADALMRRGVPGVYATTIVSSTLLGVLARARGVGYGETLTGFKWIVRAAGQDELAFGYEEALGYAVCPGLVRDKDGLSAALAVAALAAADKAQGRSLLDRLDALAAEFGVYAGDQLAVRVDDLTQITAAMARLRGAPPTTLLGRPVTSVEDRLPETDAVTVRADGVRVVVRPSGTEPKLKAYLEVVEPVDVPASIPEARRAAAAALTTVRAEITAALGMNLSLPHPLSLPTRSIRH